MSRFLFLMACFLLGGTLHAVPTPTEMEKVQYFLPYAPIDVVIPCTDKDRPVLELCIEGIRKYGKGVRRVLVISDRPLTYAAEWVDEGIFPFSKGDLCKWFSAPLRHPGRLGWIYQQLLKLYAPLVIPDISSNVLVLDADTIFLRPVSFLSLSGALYNVGTENHIPYFTFMEKLIPNLKKVFPDYSGVTHHMLFQREVIKDLFKMISDHHGIEPWQALISCIDPEELSPLSEYEIYFNFVFTRTDQMHIRPLRWSNISKLQHLLRYQNKDHDYVSCHSYLRK